MLVDIRMKSKNWQKHFSQNQLETFANSILGAAAKVAGKGMPKNSEVSINFTGNDEIKVLNKKWRNKSAATNVLSFASNEGIEKNQWSCLLGDIVLGYEIVEMEAKQQNKKFKNHVAHLLVHGFLHLLGFGHKTQARAEEMENLEIKILGLSGIGNPYE